MKTFQSKKYDFAVDIPEDWSYCYPGFLKELLGFSIDKKEFLFKGPGGYFFYVLASLLSSQPQSNFNKNIRYLKELTSRYSYTNLEYGTVKIGDKAQFWGRYRVRKFLVKKYFVRVQEKQFIITCHLGFNEADDKKIKDRERMYEEIISTLRKR